VGAAWQQGAGAPGSGVGSNGDFYLNTTNGDIYGPKAAGAWGSIIFNIAEGQEGPAGPAGPTGATGAAGPAGADGRTLLSGTSAPGSGVGANGDFFINTATSVFYGPKAGGAWPAGVSLVGPAGATGAVGPTGPAGPAGAAGATGPAGPAGAAGSSAYQVAVAGGFVGTEAQWLASLVGPQGPAGATGPAGAAGATGPQGPAGPTGAAGSAATVAVGTVTTGAAGSSATVTNGGTSSAAVLNFAIPRGDTGPAGATGAAGTAATVAVGTVTTGAAGSPATVTNAGTSSAAVLNFAIPRGDTGATGPAGATGAQGPAGVVAATAPITYDSGSQTVAISAATTSAAGSMSAADKAKLDGIASGAQVNVATDITYDAATREVRSSTGTDAVLPLVSTSSAGLAPATGTATGRFLRDDASYAHPIDTIVLACSDETTALTAGTNRVRFRMPYAATLLAVRASVNTAPTGSTLIVDINEAGTSVLGTKLSIDASETSSTTAASAATITDSSLAEDAEISIDIDQIGSTVAGAGLKVMLSVRRA